MSDSVSSTNPQDRVRIKSLELEEAKHIPGKGCITPPSLTRSPTPLDLNKISKMQRSRTPSLSCTSTEPLTTPSPIACNQGVHSPPHKRHQIRPGLKHEYAMYFDSDGESDDEPEMTIADVLNRLNGRFPALDFYQYQELLYRDGIAYLAAAIKFDCQFYVHTIGMSTGAASLFCEQIAWMKQRNDRAAARRQAAKGSKRARLLFDDEDKENLSPSCHSYT